MNSPSKALKRKIDNFEVSDTLGRFLPPTTEFTIGVQTTWSETPRSKKDAEKEEEPLPRRKQPL
jgi:hypothetical protein